MKNQRNLIALAAFALLACSASTVRADTIYDFSYTGDGIEASGTSYDLRSPNPTPKPQQ